jgi:hypothetical protein
MSAANTLAKDWTKPLPEEAEAAAKFEATLSSRRFDSKNPPPPARPIYEINGQCICTPGNLTAISAHIKSGKSAFVGAFHGRQLRARWRHLGRR